MFLNQLTIQEKEAFISLSMLAAKANGIVTEEEHVMIEEYCKEMEIAFFDSANIKPLEEVTSIFEKATDQHKKISVLEILGLMKADRQYDADEQNFVMEFVSAIGISKEWVECAENVLDKYLAILKEVAEVIS